jgi:hypothetical protein
MIEAGFEREKVDDFVVGALRRVCGNLLKVLISLMVESLTGRLEKHSNSI